MRARPAEPLAVWCVLALPKCAGRAVHRHHRLRRSQGGDDSPDNTLDVCFFCHEEIHRNPARAYEQGWMVRSGGL